MRLAVLFFAIATSLAAYGQVDAQNMGAYLTFATDYRFRGISQTDEGAAVQGGIDIQYDSGFFGGVWGSNVEFAREQRIREDPRAVELDIYAGFSWEFDENWAGVVSLVRYNYPDTSFDYDYNELALGLSYDEILSFTVAFSNDSMSRDQSALNYELGVQYPLGNQVEFGTVVGFFDAEDAIGENYVYGNIGLSKIWHRLVLDLRFHETDSDAEKVFGNYAGNQVVLSLSVPLR